MERSDYDVTPHEVMLCQDCVGTTYSMVWDNIELGEHADYHPPVCAVCYRRGASVTVEALAYRY